MNLAQLGRNVAKVIDAVGEALTEWPRIPPADPDRWRDVLEAQRLCEQAALTEDQTDKVIGAAFRRQMTHHGRWFDNVLTEIKAEVRDAS